MKCLLSLFLPFFCYSGKSANRFIGVLGLAFVIVPSVAAQSAKQWPLIEPTEYASGFADVTEIACPEDGTNRLFVLEQFGTVKIIQDGEVLATPFLDISSNVFPGNEKGLLGIAFPPDFANKQYFYVFYSNRKVRGSGVVSRFHVSEDPNLADAASEEQLMVIPQRGANHNGGKILFGPDGYLYIGVGDNDFLTELPEDHPSQDTSSWLGSILRIDVESAYPESTYGIPPGNPFASGVDGAPEVLLWGLRNPWKIAFDSLTKDFFIGDVGEEDREELDVIPFAELDAGANFGWPYKEGSQDFNNPNAVSDGLTAPVFDYPHHSETNPSDTEASFTAGYMYRGSDPRMSGLFFAGDFMTGTIWAVQETDEGWISRAILDTSHGISTFGQNEAGDLFYADYFTGTIYRIQSSDTVDNPVLSRPSNTYTSQVVLSGQVITPDAAIHYTLDGTDPETDDPVLDSPTIFVFDGPTTFKARAFREGLNPSDVVTRDYQLRPAAPQASPPGSSFNDVVTLQYAYPDGATEIRYTLDAGEPDQSSLLYNPAQGLPLTGSTHVNARAYRENWEPGLVSSIDYKLQVAAPEGMRSWYAPGDMVELFSQTPGSIIHYTLDGTTPTTDSPIWTGEQYIPAGTLIKAYAVRGDIEDSIIISSEVKRIMPTNCRYDRIAHYPSIPVDLVYLEDDVFIFLSRYGIHKSTVNGLELIHEDNYNHEFKSIALAANGDLLVADSSGYLRYGEVSRLAAPGYDWDSRIGIQTLAEVCGILAETDGSLLFTDYGGNKIKRMTTASNEETVAGSGSVGDVDGLLAQARFNGPSRLAFDPNGNVLIADTNNHKIRKMVAGETVETFAGTGVAGWADGPLLGAQFYEPYDIGVDSIGNVYVLEIRYGYQKIRKITPEGLVTTLIGEVYETSGTLIYDTSLGHVSVESMDVQADGIIYVADHYLVYKITQKDWDNDGIDDELEASLSPAFTVGVDDRYADFDEDGVPNIVELLAGSDPTLVSDKKRIKGVGVIGDGNVVYVSLPYQVGSWYQLEFSNNLKDWFALGEPFQAATEFGTQADKLSERGPARFYRLQLLPSAP